LSGPPCTSGRWSEVTAVFGGAFDPPHLGHREAVRGLFASPGVGRVLVVPAGAPPLKASATPAADREAMTRLAFDGLGAGVRIDGRELRRKAGPSYAFDTLSELAREHRELAFVIGTDQLLQLPRWHRFPEVLGLAHWIVLLRKPGGAEELGRGIKDLLSSGIARPVASADRCWQLARGRVLQAVQTDAPALSSTEIRENLAKTGQVQPQTLSPAVEAYLKTHRLYGTGPS